MNHGPMPANPLTAAYTERDRVAKLKATEAAAWATRLADLDRQIAAQDRIIALAGDGLDLGKIAIAERFLLIRGKIADARVGRDGGSATARSEVKRDAILDLAAGGARLGREAFGVKNYEGFGDQRNDSEYGMGPRHGSIVFSIGLAPDARKPDYLDAEQIEAAVYYLHNLAAIQAAKVPA